MDIKPISQLDTTTDSIDSDLLLISRNIVGEGTSYRKSFQVETSVIKTAISSAVIQDVQPQIIDLYDKLNGVSSCTELSLASISDAIDAKYNEITTDYTTKINAVTISCGQISSCINSLCTCLSTNVNKICTDLSINVDKICTDISTDVSTAFINTLNTVSSISTYLSGVISALDGYSASSFVHISSIEKEQIQADDSKIPSLKLLNTFASSVDISVANHEKTIEEIQAELRSVSFEKYEDLGTNSKFSLKDHMVNIVHPDSNEVELVFPTQKTENKIRELVVVIHTDKNKENDIYLKFEKDIAFRSDSITALNFILAGTDTLLYFKEIDSKIFIVERRVLNTLDPATQIYFTIIEKFVDENSSKCEDDKTYSRAKNVWWTFPSTPIGNYTFQYWTQNGKTIEYNAGDSVQITSDTTFIGHYLRNTTYYVNFYSDNDQLSSYTINNHKIIAPIDTTTGKVYTTIEYPSLVKRGYQLSWDKQIPDIATLTCNMDIYAIWTKSITQDETVEDDEVEVYKVTPDGGSQIVTQEELDEHEIILLALSADTNYTAVLATQKDDLQSLITIT